MKITKLGSATVIVDTGDAKILTDPWLVDGAYYGSWCNYPPIPIKQINFKQIDFIYVSHIHLIILILKLLNSYLKTYLY